jgi:hypothetical protein
MKKNLGKIILFLLLPFTLFGDSNLASFSLTSNKKDVVIKEPVLITFKADQKDHTSAMFFFLEAKKSDAYEVLPLDQITTKTSKHNVSTTFKYLLFPLKSGDIDVDFDFTIKVTSDGDLVQVYTGGKDNIKWMDTVNSKIEVPTLHLHVSPLSEKVDLVGDFTLDAKLQKSDINQYGSANIRYTLSGAGYNEKSLQMLSKIADVTAFSQVTDIASKATPNGYEIKREYSYALRSKKNFTIPAIEIKAYSPKQNKYYTLKSQSYDIKVSSIDPKTLVDNKEFPLSKSYDFENFKDIGIALLIFLAGFVSAKIAPRLSFKRVKKQKFQDIKESKTPKELIIVLLQNYKSPITETYIKELELLEYKKSQRSFQKIKSDLLKNIM